MSKERMAQAFKIRTAPLRTRREYGHRLSEGQHISKRAKSNCSHLMSSGDKSIIVAALDGDDNLDVKATAVGTRMPE